MLKEPLATRSSKVKDGEKSTEFHSFVRVVDGHKMFVSSWKFIYIVVKLWMLSVNGQINVIAMSIIFMICNSYIVSILLDMMNFLIFSNKEQIWQKVFINYIHEYTACELHCSYVYIY